MLDSLLRTDTRSSSLLFLRVLLGSVMLPHGLQKTLGLFGGHGFDGTMGFFTGVMGLPAPLAFLVIVAESLGAVALLFGLGTRVAAAGMVAVMAGAVATAHAGHGFFMNWSGTQGGEGFEYHLLVAGIGAVVVARGGGRLAVDSWLRERLSGSTTSAPRELAPAA